MSVLNSDLSDLNSMRILRAVWFRPGISRAELARDLRLDKSTVTKIVTGLIQAGILMDIAKRESGPKGGRKPISLTVNSSYGCVLGVEIQTECFRADIIDLGGEVLLRHEESMDLSRGTIADAFRSICSRMRDRIVALRVPLIGIGLGLPGIVDSRTGTILLSKPLRITEPYPFFEELRRAEQSQPATGPMVNGVPVMIDNDARCGCWSVLSYHRAKSPKNFLFLFGEFRSADHVDRKRKDLSVGFGIVLDGRVYYGDEGASGEFISVFRDTDQDNQFSITDDEAQRIESDPLVRHRVLRELARNAGLVSNVINVNTIYIGGSILSFGEELVGGIGEEARRYATSPRNGSLTVRVTSHGEHVVAYGAAGMMLERFFTVPEVTSGTSRQGPPLPHLMNVRPGTP
jgi:predicted NBD/HSP70 family sugar kinase